MATELEEKAVLTITAKEFTNPLVIDLLDKEVSFPFTGKMSVVATSPPGKLVEDVNVSLEVEGLEIVNNAQVTQLPINLSGILGTVVSEIVEAADATIEIDIESVTPPPVATPPAAS